MHMLKFIISNPNHSYTSFLNTGPPAGCLVQSQLSLRSPPSYSGLCSWWAEADHWRVSLWCWTSPSLLCCPWHGDVEPCLMTKRRMVWLNKEGERRRRNQRRRQTKKMKKRRRRRRRRRDPKEPPRCGKWSYHWSFQSHHGCMWCQTCSGWPGRNQVGLWKKTNIKKGSKMLEYTKILSSIKQIVIYFYYSN